MKKIDRIRYACDEPWPYRRIFWSDSRRRVPIPLCLTAGEWGSDPSDVNYFFTHTFIGTFGLGALLFRHRLTTVRIFKIWLKKIDESFTTGNLGGDYHSQPKGNVSSVQHDSGLVSLLEVRMKTQSTKVFLYQNNRR